MAASGPHRGWGSGSAALAPLHGPLAVGQRIGRVQDHLFAVAQAGDDFEIRPEVAPDRHVAQMRVVIFDDGDLRAGRAEDQRVRRNDQRLRLPPLR